MTQKNTLAIIAVLAAVLSVSTFSIVLNSAEVQAQEEQSFSAALSGSDEVPPTESNSTGTAKFQVTENNDNESQVSYWVNITGIREVNAAHIHNGTTGENGDIVATLSNGESAEGDERPPQIGFAGNITGNELQGPLEDEEISDLVSLMSDGNAYVNVHTDRYPDGAIRGQITSASESTDTGASTNATTASTDTSASTNATSSSSSTDSGTDSNSNNDGQQETASSQSTDSPDMDIDESMK